VSHRTWCRKYCKQVFPHNIGTFRVSPRKADFCSIGACGPDGPHLTTSTITGGLQDSLSGRAVAHAVGARVSPTCPLALKIGAALGGMTSALGARSAGTRRRRMHMRSVGARPALTSAHQLKHQNDLCIKHFDLKHFDLSDFALSDFAQTRCDLNRRDLSCVEAS
jgi:hypothetical protein